MYMIYDIRSFCCNNVELKSYSLVPSWKLLYKIIPTFDFVPLTLEPSEYHCPQNDEWD